MTVDGLILAAGLSSRMGEFKPLLKLQGETYVACIAQKLLPLCRRVLVVTGHRANDVRDALNTSEHGNKIEFAHNAEFQQGMFSSLQAAMRVVRDADWVLCHWVDQPHLPTEFYPEFLRECGTEHDVIQPAYSGRRGHPLLLNRAVIDLVLSAPITATLRDVLETDVVKHKLWLCEFPQILEDFDTPDDVARVLPQPKR